MYEDIAEWYNSIEDAIGVSAIHGCQIEEKEYSSTNPGLICQGCTVKFYACTADGNRWAVHFNPTA